METVQDLKSSGPPGTTDDGIRSQMYIGVTYCQLVGTCILYISLFNFIVPSYTGYSQLHSSNFVN